jgi:hypothetical protein
MLLYGITDPMNYPPKPLLSPVVGFELADLAFGDEADDDEADGTLLSSPPVPHERTAQSTVNTVITTPYRQ